MGHLQWFDVLNRLRLAVHEEVYSFGEGRSEDLRQALPDSFFDEILLSVLLSAFWTADLGRPYLPLLVASDASTSFGFGGAAARLPVDKVREVARLAEKRGDYVRLDGADLDKEPRLGQPDKLGLSFQMPTSCTCLACAPGRWSTST